MLCSAQSTHDWKGTVMGDLLDIGIFVPEDIDQYWHIDISLLFYPWQRSTLYTMIYQTTDEGRPSSQCLLLCLLHWLRKTKCTVALFRGLALLLVMDK